LLNDVLSDIEFLWGDLKMRKIMDTLEPENICFMKEKNAYFLGNWAKIFEKSTLGNEVLATTTILSKDQSQNQMTSQKLADEIKALAFAVLELIGIDTGELKSLGAISRVGSKIYDVAVRTIVSDAFKDSKHLQNKFERMLSLNPQNLPSLIEIKGIDHGFEETKYVKIEPKVTENIQDNTSLEKPNKIIGKLCMVNHILPISLAYSTTIFYLFILIDFSFVKK